MKKQTHNRISGLPPLPNDHSTALVLTNAVYFLGEWPEPFEIETRKNDFSTRDGKKVFTQLLSKVLYAEYAAFNADGSPFDTPEFVDDEAKTKCYPDGDGFQVAELGYKGDTVSMLIVLPQNPTDGLGQLEAVVTDVNLNRWAHPGSKRTIRCYLPKFKMDTSYHLIESLQAMGMNRVFVKPSPFDGAQFEGISNPSDPTKKLYVSNVIQEALLDVNEKGTEAVAVTRVTGSYTLGLERTRERLPFVPIFRADRPFLFLIRDNATGSILFMGRFIKPSA